MIRGMNLQAMEGISIGTTAPSLSSVAGGWATQRFLGETVKIHRSTDRGDPDR